MGLFAASQLARVTTPLLPLALVVLTPAIPGAIARPWPALIRAIVPFGVVAAPLALLEASARQTESIADIGLGPRLAWTLTHPAQYVWRTLVPGTLNPLDPLPRLPVADWTLAAWAVLGTIAVLAVTVRLWSRPAAGAAVWVTYGLLLAPVVGLVPSGLQVTADRYTYIPAMVLSAALGALILRARRPWRFVLALAITGAAAGVLAQSARTQLPYWSDSISVWSRAVALDADNDVALYNLALAVIEQGRHDAAIDHLARLVAQVPDHALGRTRLDALVADRELRAAEASAAARSPGRGDRGIRPRARPGSATDPRPPGPRHGRFAIGGRGSRRRRPGKWPCATAEDDPAVISALAYTWAATGRGAEAVPLLTRAVERHPADVGLASNLARLLVTVEPASLRDPVRALELAVRANDATAAATRAPSTRWRGARGNRPPQGRRRWPRRWPSPSRASLATSRWPTSFAAAPAASRCACQRDVRHRRTHEGRPGRAALRSVTSPGLAASS